MKLHLFLVRAHQLCLFHSTKCSFDDWISMWSSVTTLHLDRTPTTTAIMGQYASSGAHLLSIARASPNQLNSILSCIVESPSRERDVQRLVQCCLMAKEGLGTVKLCCVGLIAMARTRCLLPADSMEKLFDTLRDDAMILSVWPLLQDYRHHLSTEDVAFIDHEVQRYKNNNRKHTEKSEKTSLCERKDEEGRNGSEGLCLSARREEPSRLAEACCQKELTWALHHILFLMLVGGLKRPLTHNANRFLFSKRHVRRCSMAALQAPVRYAGDISKRWDVLRSLDPILCQRARHRHAPTRILSDVQVLCNKTKKLGKLRQDTHKMPNSRVPYPKTFHKFPWRRLESLLRGNEVAAPCGLFRQPVAVTRALIQLYCSGTWHPTTAQGQRYLATSWAAHILSHLWESDEEELRAFFCVSPEDRHVAGMLYTVRGLRTVPCILQCLSRWRMTDKTLLIVPYLLSTTTQDTVRSYVQAVVGGEYTHHRWSEPEKAILALFGYRRVPSNSFFLTCAERRFRKELHVVRYVVAGDGLSFDCAVLQQAVLCPRYDTVPALDRIQRKAHFLTSTEALQVLTCINQLNLWSLVRAPLRIAFIRAAVMTQHPPLMVGVVPWIPPGISPRKLWVDGKSGPLTLAAAVTSWLGALALLPSAKPVELAWLITQLSEEFQMHGIALLTALHGGVTEGIGQRILRQIPSCSNWRHAVRLLSLMLCETTDTPRPVLYAGIVKAIPCWLTCLRLVRLLPKMPGSTTLRYIGDQSWVAATLVLQWTQSHRSLTSHATRDVFLHLSEGGKHHQLMALAMRQTSAAGVFHLAHCARPHDWAKDGRWRDALALATSQVHTPGGVMLAMHLASFLSPQIVPQLRALGARCLPWATSPDVVRVGINPLLIVTHGSMQRYHTRRTRDDVVALDTMHLEGRSGPQSLWVQALESLCALRTTGITVMRSAAPRRGGSGEPFGFASGGPLPLGSHSTDLLHVKLSEL